MGLFEEQEAVKAGVERVLAVLANYKRGDVCPWQVIEEAAGFERYTRHWAAFFKRARRDFMRATGIAMLPVTDIGMELLTVTDQLVRRAEKRRRKALRQFRRDEQELAAIPASEMSVKQQQMRASQIAAARQGKKDINRHLRLTRILCRPTPKSQPHGRDMHKSPRFPDGKSSE